MTPKEYKWNVNLVKSRYDYLELSYEQAENIYKYEHEKLIYAACHYFTVWEESDYELSVFTQFLNSDQLTKYHQLRKENIERYEQQLVESDNHKENLNQLAYNEALLIFHETQLSTFFEHPHMLNLGWLGDERPKIEYLKSEYKRYLGHSKLSVLSTHFRNYRSFQPNTLKLSLLQHKHAYVWPDYLAFKQSMDEPTKTIAKHLASKMNYLPEKIERFLTQKFEELTAFNNKNFKKHYSNQNDIHVVKPNWTQEDEKEYRAMILVLLDRQKYNS